LIYRTRSIRTGIAGVILALTLFSATANAQDAEAGKDAESKTKEPKYGWEGSLNFGLTVTTGNSNTTTGNTSIETKLTEPKHILHLGASNTYGKNGSEVTANKSNAFAEYNYLLTERISPYLKGAVDRDLIANLLWRFNVGPGLGYFFIKRPAATLIGELGVSYVREKFEKTEADDYYALRMAERGEWKISKTSKIWEKAEYLPDISDFTGKFIFNGEAGVEAMMTTKVSLRLVIQDTFNSKPATGRNKNDALYIAGFGYKF
jgi:putative salt-induced outer membrane protein